MNWPENCPGMTQKMVTNLLYTTSHIKIKLNNRITDYAPNYFFIFNACRKNLKKNTDWLKTCIDTLENNFYGAHPESVLIGMLGDERQPVREVAINTIKSTRLRKQLGHLATVRVFDKPVLNFNAKVYTDMVDLDDFEPPLLQFKNVDQYLITPLVLNYIPVHTQSVEQVVQQTAKKTKVMTLERAEKSLRCDEKSRSVQPKVQSKQDFVDKMEMMEID